VCGEFHDYPIFPDFTRDKIVDGPNQLWVADITYIAIATGSCSQP
jgi:putative transposase